MSKRSSSGSTLPPTVGVVSDELLDARSDLRKYAGWAVHVPKTVDIALAMESLEVLLDSEAADWALAADLQL